MSLYVEINAVDQRGLDPDIGIVSARVDQSLSNRNTAAVVIIDRNSSALLYSEGQQISIGNGAERYFSGTIAAIDITWMNPKGSPPAVQYALSCVSYDQIASRRIVTIPQIYTDRSAGYIVRDIATQFLGAENVDVTQVQDGPTFATFTVESGASVYEVFDSISEKAGMYWDILGTIAQKDLRLYSRGSLSSAWSITATSPIVVGGEGEAGITVTTDRQGLANKVHVELAEGPGSPTTQDFIGDGSSREFTLDKPVDGQPIIRVNGVEKAVSLKGYTTSEWYYTAGSATLEQDASQAVLQGPGAGNPTGDLLSVDYTPRERVVILGAQDATAISARAILEATSGKYEVVISATDGATVTDATSAATAYLNAHKNPAKRLSIRSFDAQAETLGIGETITVTLPVLGVSGSFLVEKVTREHKGKLSSDGSDAILHTFTLSSGSVLGDWATLFASAWGSGATVSGGAGAVISGGSVGRATVQDLGTLAADTTVTPSPSSPVDGDLLLVTWSLASTIYTLTWGTGFAATAKADYRPRTPSSHAYFFAYLIDKWTLISWRTDI